MDKKMGRGVKIISHNDAHTTPGDIFIYTGRLQEIEMTCSKVWAVPLLLPLTHAIES